MENSKYKKIIENGEVEDGQLAIIHIPSTLHSDDANHVVTTTDEVYDIPLKKRQFIINQQQEEFTKKQEKFNQQQEEINQKQKEFSKQQEEINQQQEEFNRKQEEINQEQEEFNQEQEVINQQQEEINREHKYINEQQQEFNNSLFNFKEKSDNFLQQQEYINDSQKLFNEGQTVINKRQENLNEKQEVFNKNVTTFVEEQKEINKHTLSFIEEQTNTNEYVKNFIEDQIDINQKQENFNVKQDCFNYKQKKINQEVRLDLDSIKLEIAAAGGDISAIKNILTNYLTKETFEYILEEEISKLEVILKEYTNTNLKDFYTKTEIENLINNNEIDLSGYYTKSEVDNKFLELEIDKILNNVSLSMSCSPSSIFEKGLSVSHIVTLKVNNFTLNDKTLLSCYIKKNGVIVAESTGSTVSYSDTIVNTVSYSGVVTYKNNVKSWSSSCTRSAYNRTYYGFGMNEEDVFVNGHSKITSSAKGTYADTAKVDDVYYYIIVPSGVSCPSTFTMNATPFVIDKSSLTKNNITYTVLKSGSAFGIGGEVNINAQ